MRNISFSLTEAAFNNGTKDVTRRLGWTFLKPGDKLMACRKCMGRKPGEPLVRLDAIEVVSVRREVLMAIRDEDVHREGFPFWDHMEFVAFFCKSHKGCTPLTEVTRIEFKRLYMDACGDCDPCLFGHPDQCALIERPRAVVAATSDKCLVRGGVFRLSQGSKPLFSRRCLVEGNSR